MFSVQSLAKQVLIVTTAAYARYHSHIRRVRNYVVTMLSGGVLTGKVNLLTKLRQSLLTHYNVIFHIRCRIVEICICLFHVLILSLFNTNRINRPQMYQIVETLRKFVQNVCAFTKKCEKSSICLNRGYLTYSQCFF